MLVRPRLVAGFPDQLPVLVDDAHVAEVDELEARREVVVVVGAGVPRVAAAVEDGDAEVAEHEGAGVGAAHGLARRLPRGGAGGRVMDLDEAEVVAEAAGARGRAAPNEGGDELAGGGSEEGGGRVGRAVRGQGGEDLLLDLPQNGTRGDGSTGGGVIGQGRRKDKEIGDGDQQEEGRTISH